MKFFLFFVVCLFLGASSPMVEDVGVKMLGMHVIGKNVIWNECGKRYRMEQAQERADEYARAIVDSIKDVRSKTGIEVNADDVRAILFRESSDDECVIGRQETDRLRLRLQEEPKKSDYLGHIKKWRSAVSEARKECLAKKLSSDCAEVYIEEHYPEYKGIYAWDIGAAQYRWPGARINKRSVVIRGSDGLQNKIIVGIDDLLDYRVSIQLLVEDLAHYRESCKKHTHWLVSKWGKRIRKLDVEEAYLVHHHTGEGSWSLKYYRRISDHLEKIRSIPSDGLVTLLDDILFMRFVNRRYSV